VGVPQDVVNRRGGGVWEGEGVGEGAGGGEGRGEGEGGGEGGGEGEGEGGGEGKAREKAREGVEERARKKRKKVKMKSEKREMERGWESKGEGRLSFTAEAPSPPRPAGRAGRPSSTGRRPPAQAAWSRGSLTPAAGWPLLQQEQHRRLRWKRTAPPEAGRHPPMSWRTRTATATG
jgi:hypothetical protein